MKAGAVIERGGVPDVIFEVIVKLVAICLCSTVLSFGLNNHYQELQRETVVDSERIAAFVRAADSRCRAPKVEALSLKSKVVTEYDLQQIRAACQEPYWLADLLVNGPR